MATSAVHPRRITPGVAPTPAGMSGVGRTHRHLRRRLVAFALDTCLLAVLIFLGAVVLSATMGPAMRFVAAGPGIVDHVVLDARLARVTMIAGIATGCGYFCVSWLLLHATPGQRLFGLEVRERDDGGRLSAGRALSRWVVLGAPLWIAASSASGRSGIAASVGLFVWFLCLLVTTARSATGRGWHDRLSGSRVVLTERARPIPAMESREESPDVR